MDRLGIRDLRINTAAAVRRAGAGERVIITVAGRPVAQLGPLEPVDAEVTLEDLAARGLATLARTEDRSAPGEVIQVWAGFRLDRVLRDVRGR